MGQLSPANAAGDVAVGHTPDLNSKPNHSLVFLRAGCVPFYCKCCIKFLLVETIEKEKNGRVKQSINVTNVGGYEESKLK